MRNFKNITLLILFFLGLMVNSHLTGQSILVQKNANWKYLDDGTDQGTVWKESSFDDSSWASGNAQLGYGDDDETTVLSYGGNSNNKYITYYFRHEFNVADPNQSVNLNLKVLRDDGAIVYINGTEVQRTNMPSGAIDYLTHASSTVGGSDEDVFNEYLISSDQLVAGTNIIAVEIHQRSSSSSDISFNLELSTEPTQYIQAGEEWKYLDNGTDQGTAWKEASFDDSSWALGNAQLGYGDGDEETVVSYGGNSSNKYITYYFRHEFNVYDPSQSNYLSLEILRDDGAVVYINGTEVQRSNMPSGAIDYFTYASSSVGGSDEGVFNEYIIPSDQLVAGTNIIAVEIHQRSSSSSDISFDLKLSTTSQTLSAFRKAPYLIYSGDNTEMIILWQLNFNINSTLDWGTDLTYSTGSQTTNEYGYDHQHKYTITDLSNSTDYYYRVIANTDTIKGHFVSGPSDEVSDITFIAYGDTRTNPDDHDMVAQQILNTYSNDPEAQTMILLSGDMVSDGNVESYWDEQFFDPEYTKIQEMLRSAPLVSALGNHEGSGILFGKYFPYPYYESGDYYWSFDYGPVHISIVDQDTFYNPGSTQYQWLENDLASTTKKWKIVMFHEPGWSAGGHGNNTDVQNYIQPLCEKYDVQFVINGHNHYYSRAVVERVNHITTGGGGAPLYSPDSSYPNIVKVNQSNHFTKLHISGDTLYFTAIRSDGTVIEQFSYNRIYVWNGSVNTDWNNGDNWDMGVVPKAVSEVLIPSGLTNYPEIDGMYECHKIVTEAGTNLHILNSGQLKIH